MSEPVSPDTVPRDSDAPAPNQGGPAPSRYRLIGAVFVRLMGIVYLMAFASLGAQVLTLIGSRGLLPIAVSLERASGFALPRVATRKVARGFTGPAHNGNRILPTK